MPTKIKLIKAVEYLHISPDGEIDFEKSKQLLIEIAKSKKFPADYDLILDFRHVQFRLTTADIYFLAAELLKHRDAFKNKIAVLFLPGANIEKAEFFELCSQNRGFNVDIFTNYEDAVDWLFESFK